MKGKETITPLQGRKPLEEELSACKQLLEEVYIPLAEAADEACFLVDRDCTYLFINKNMSNHLNISVKEAIGKNYVEFHGPEIARIFAETIAEIFATGVTRQDEHVNREGTKIVYRTFYPIKSPQGEVIKVAVFAQDITKLKEMEATLKKSEDRYRDIVENSGDLICTHDLEGRLISVNKASEKLIGFPQEILIGRNLRDLMDPEVREAFNSYLTTIRESGTSRGLMRVITAAGEKRILEYNNSLRTEGVAAPVVRGIARDVTDRLVAEKRLNDTLSLLTATLEAAASGILAVDNRGEILTCNSKFSRMWHIPEDIISAKKIDPVLTLVSNQLFDVEGFLAQRREIMSMPDLEFSDELFLKDGRIFERTSKPQWSDGKIVGRVYSFTDITARKNNEERYRALVESAGEAVYTVDRECRYIFITENLAARYKTSVADIIGKKYSDLHSPEESRTVAEKVAEVVAKGSPCHDEHFNRQGKHVLRYFYPIKAPVPGGEIVMVGVLSQDITDRIKLEQSLRESEERYRTIIENIEEGYYEVDLAGNYRFVNEACLNIFGYSRSEILGFNIRKCTDEENSGKINNIFKIVSSTGYPSLGCEWEVLRKNGEKRHVESSISPIRNVKGNTLGFRGVIRDVTEKKKAEEAVHHMAHHDFLTGLPNRFLFHDRLNMALAQARRHQGKIALVTLDLDRFKEINDKLGHDIGDVLLQKVGKRLAGLIREGDTVARMGGDEFTLLLHSINDNSDVAIIATKVLDALRGPFDCDEHELSITPSIGIAIYPDHGLAMSTVLKNADQAMYRAKEKGNRYYVYGQL